jgi:hypothetical protein
LADILFAEIFRETGRGFTENHFFIKIGKFNYRRLLIARLVLLVPREYRLETLLGFDGHRLRTHVLPLVVRVSTSASIHINCDVVLNNHASVLVHCVKKNTVYLVGQVAPTALVGERLCDNPGRGRHKRRVVLPVSRRKPLFA